jgi:hypothetical protein
MQLLLHINIIKLKCDTDAAEGGAVDGDNEGAAIEALDEPRFS